MPWPNQLANGRTLPDWSQVPRRYQRKALKFRGPLYPQPNEVCRGGRYECSNSMVRGAAKDWFTNRTFIPGEPTIADDMYDAPSSAALQRIKLSKTPWNSPGTAPTFGEGCGASGGNPNGCQCDQEGPVNFCYGNDERPYGSCCAQVCLSSLQFSIFPKCQIHLEILFVRRIRLWQICDGACGRWTL